MEINNYLIEAFKNLGKSQKEVVKDLNKPQPYVSALMNGKKNVGKDVAKQLSDLYGFDEGAILTGETLHENKKSQYLKNSDVHFSENNDEVEIITNKNGIKFFLFPDDTTEIEVYQVPFPAYASYIEAFNDEEKLNHEFNKIRFKVDKIGKGNYVSFKSKNDSMNGGGLNDTPGGADILAREVGKHLWKDGFHKSVYGFILLTQKGIYHKDIKNYNKETGMLTLSSRNKACEDFEFPINEVFKIFNVIKRSF